MSVFESPYFDRHEAVHFVTDAAAGLAAVIAVHSTALGPAAGGCRLWTYPDSAAALVDALRLSRGMSYKNAIAGLDLGGGKAVVMRPQPPFDRPRLFTAFGRAVESLGGRYITAEDVGVSVGDMEVVAQVTQHVAGLAKGASASGDPSPWTALGVFLAIQAAAKRALGRDDLQGLTVAVQGVGHVGLDLCRRLHEAGARLIVADVNEAAIADAKRRFDAKVVAPEDIHKVEADVFAPCALGAILNRATIGAIKARIIAGAANNQLADDGIGAALASRGILYAPDYVVNGGGIINVAAEVGGRYDSAAVEARIERLIATLDEIFARAAREARPTNLIADEMARARIAAARR